MTLDTTQELVDELRRGRMVVLADAEDRENEGDLVLAADFVTPEAINFMAMHARGLICLTLTEEKCRSLNLPLMVNDNRSPMGTAFTVSIEAASGVSTGISAADRARTVRAATAKHAKASDIVQPGHIFPVMAQNGGRAGARGPHRGRMRSGRSRGTHARGGHLRDHESRRLHGAHARAARVREDARPQDRHDRRPHPPPQRERAPHRARSRMPGQHALWPVPLLHLSRPHRRRGALRAGEGRACRPIARCSVRVHEPFVSLDMFDFDSSRHAYSVQDAMRIVAQHKEGVIVLLRRPEGAVELLERLSRKREDRNARELGTAAAPASARRSSRTWVSARCASSRVPSAFPACRASGSRWSSTSRPMTPW